MSVLVGNYPRHPMRTTTMLSKNHLSTFAMLGALALAPACVTNSGGLGALDDGDGGGDAGDGDESGTSDGNSGSDGGDMGDTDEPGDTDGPGDTGDTGEPACETPDIGISAARVMDSTKWANAVRDLLGFDPTVDALYTDIGFAGPFPTQPATEQTRAGLELAAAQVAAQIPDAFVQCNMGGGCLEAFAESFARAAWRRDLTDDELAAIVPDTGNHDDDVRGVIEAVLSNPLFYELTETGAPDPTDATRRVLDGRSIATRLSFLVWNSLPDAELLELASTDALSDPEVRRDQIQRMLDTPRAEVGLGDYVQQWLELRLSPKNEDVFPGYDDTLRQSMLAETRRFYTDLLLEGDGMWSTLLTADYSFVNGSLAAEVYGDDIVGAPPVGDALELVQLDPTRRLGVLSQAAPMAAWSYDQHVGISLRGIPVRENMLCQLLPPPPDDVDIGPADPDLQVNSRHEFVQAIVGEPSCAGCHELFDPIHLAFDNYDAIGRWQTELGPNGSLADGMNDVPAEPYGTLIGLQSPDVEFATREELIDALVTLPETGQCAVVQHMQFSFGRSLEEADQCFAEQITELYEESGRHLPTLIEELAASELFIRVRL